MSVVKGTTNVHVLVCECTLTLFELSRKVTHDERYSISTTSE